MTARIDAVGLWLICIGLLCAIAVEFVFPSTPGMPVVVGAYAPRVVAVARPDRTHQYATMALARPLFTANRRPPADAARPASGRAAAMPRLTGIVIAASTRRALFDNEGKLLVGLVGEHVGPYAIVAITPRQVSVFGPSGLETLTPGFSSAPRATAPSGPSILDRLRSQQFRPPALPSPAALNRLLLQQTHAATAAPR